MAWKKLTMVLAWGLALAGWSALAAFYFTGPPTEHWLMAVTGAAVLTEIAFWATAAVLGVTLWESRKAVFRMLTRPFRGGKPTLD